MVPKVVGLTSSTTGAGSVFFGFGLGFGLGFGFGFGFSTTCATSFGSSTFGFSTTTVSSAFSDFPCLLQLEWAFRVRQSSFLVL